MSETNSDDDQEAYHFVCILTSNGEKQVVMKRQHFDLILPTFYSQYFSPVQSLEYLSSLKQQLDIEGHTHIVEEVEFIELEESGGPLVSLVIVEITSGQRLKDPSLELTPWHIACDHFDRCCEFSSVSKFLRTFGAPADSLKEKRRYTPWFNLGFYHKMRPVFCQLLNDKGYSIKDEPEQFRFSYRSVVYRVQTGSGQMFIKVCPTGSKEVSVTKLISNLFPKQVPCVVNDSEEFNSILTADFGPNMADACFFSSLPNVTSGYDDPDAIASLIFTQWANMQKESIDLVPALRAGGLPVHDSSWMQSGLVEVTNYSKKYSLLPAARMPSIQSCEKFIEETFCLWQESNIPETLVHGDLHEGNVGQSQGSGTNFLFFDWDFAFIGYPFLDLKDSELRPMYKNTSTYLKQWDQYTDLETIARLSERSKALQSLVSAVVEMRSPFIEMQTRNMVVRENLEEFFEGVYAEYYPLPSC